MIEKNNLSFFLNRYCMIILDNGFTYSGVLKKIDNGSISFDDRFEGLKIFDLSIVKSIGQIGENHDRLG